MVGVTFKMFAGTILMFDCVRLVHNLAHILYIRYCKLGDNEVNWDY